MASPKLRLLKPSELTVTLAQQRPVYIFINSNDGMPGGTHDTYGTYSNNSNSRFANLIRKITMNNDDAN